MRQSPVHNATPVLCKSRDNRVAEPGQVAAVRKVASSGTAHVNQSIPCCPSSMSAAVQTEARPQQKIDPSQACPGQAAAVPIHPGNRTASDFLSPFNTAEALFQISVRCGAPLSFVVEQWKEKLKAIPSTWQHAAAVA